MTAARPEFNGRATAVLKLHLIRSHEFDTIPAPCLKHASEFSQFISKEYNKITRLYDILN